MSKPSSIDPNDSVDDNKNRSHLVDWCSGDVCDGECVEMVAEARDGETVSFDL